MFSAVTMVLKMSSGTSTRGIHLQNEKQQETGPALALSATSNSPARKRRAVLVCGGRELARGRRIPKRPERPSGRWAVAWLPGPPGRAPRCRKCSAAESRSLRTTMVYRYLWAIFCAILSHRCRTDSLEMRRKSVYHLCIIPIFVNSTSIIITHA